MKKLLAGLFTLCLFSPAFSQTPASYRLTYGEEIKLKKGTTDLDIVAADNSGTYFTESRMRMTGYFVIGASYGETVKLMKLDKNFGEVFDRDYKKDLKGYTYHSFQTLGEDLYMFVTDYEKKEKQFKVFGAKVDKNSGDLVGDFQELGSYQLESKKDDYEMKVQSIQNGNAFLMVSNISGKEKVTLGVHVLDKKLKRKESATIYLPFDPQLYTLQDVQYNKSEKIIVLGKEFDEAQIGKKKRKRLVFKQYVMNVYDKEGKELHYMKMDSEDRYVISGKLIEHPSGEMLLAGFYSNNAKKEDLNGFFINKVNTENGTMSLSSFKEINSSMLGKGYMDETDDDDMSKEEKKQAKKAKDDDDEEEFPNSFSIKSVNINPTDNSIIISSEVSRYSFYTYTQFSTSGAGATRTTRTTTYYVHRFTNQDILIINADKDGNIRWLNALPKSQFEQVRTSSSAGMGLSFSQDQGRFFATGGGMPYYSSYASLIHNNNLVVILNDHTSNNINAEYGDKVKTVYNFRKKSNVYGISIDLATGKMTRKIIGSNNDETILMPRHAFVLKNELIIPSWRQHMMAKTDLRFARISVK